MATNKLGRRMNHDISAMGDWIDNRGTGGCVVNDQWEPVLVGDFRYGGDINRVKLWVANGFGVDGFGVRLDGCLEGTWVKWIDKRCRNTELWERVAEEVPRPTIETGGRNNMIASSSDVQDCKDLSSLTTCRCKRRCATLKSRNPLFKDIVGRVHQAGVNVPKLCK